MAENFISPESDIGEGAKIYAPSYICGKSHIGKNAVIMPFSYIEDSYVGEGATVFSCTLTGAHIGDNCRVGPYAYLRENAYICDNCRIGDFVEVKNSRLGRGTKAAHLAYIGDAEIGQDVNIGCGAVFCNYDGKVKSKTVVGDGAFIGANCNLIAPLKIGKGAFIAAGTTVDSDMGDGEFRIGRSRPYIKPQGAAGRYKNGK